MTRRHNMRNHFVGEPPRRMQRHATAVGQPGHALGIVTLQPLVNGLASDLINPGQRLNAFPFVVILNQLDTKIHGSVLLPRHCL